MKGTECTAGGKLSRPDGKVYRGYWVNGKQHGEGEIFVPSENKWHKGIWNRGKRVNRAELKARGLRNESKTSEQLSELNV